MILQGKRILITEILISSSDNVLGREALIELLAAHRMRVEDRIESEDEEMLC